jgi:MFS family permease
VPASPEALAAERSRDRWRLALAAFAVLLAAADTYVVVVALPSIMTGVGVGLDRLQRATPIISGFLLGYTAVLPLIGRLADLAGTGPVFAGCLSAFAVGSVVTATAHALPVVVAGRALQGVGGGGLVPVTQAMVAARWPPDARGLPLGLVGALQELGSVVGPLYGAAIVAVASWRAIFWINVPVTVVLGAGFWLTRRGRLVSPVAAVGGDSGASPVAALSSAGRRSRASPVPAPAPGLSALSELPDLIGLVLVVVAAAGLMVGLDTPASLANSAAVGRVWTPVVTGPWAPFTTPIVLVAGGVLVAFLCWERFAPSRVRPLVRLDQAWAVLARADLPGAVVLAAILGCVVVLFSTADPSKQVVASSAPFVAPVAVALIGLFYWRQRRARAPLIEPGALAARPAWGALVVNLALGAALMAALVDVPLFARATVDPNSEVAAALVLVRFLVPVPIGAVIGGALCRSRSRAPVVAAIGMAMAAVSFVGMASWSATALGGGPRWSDVELLTCGLGFGLAIAPVNVAILGAVRPSMHALTSALAVAARTIGMLAGLSTLTAIGLHRFYAAQARIGSPLVLCPTSPESCPAYDTATSRALLSELHTIFGGAGVCAAAAGVLALLLLRSSAIAGADVEETVASSAVPPALG